MSRSRPDTGGIAAGVVFTIIGVVFFLDELDVWTVRMDYVVPLVLIAVGVSLLISRMVSVSGHRHE